MMPFATICPWLEDPLRRLEQAAAAGRLGHGWLISGPRGTGKANLAYVLADRLLSGRIGEPLPAPAAARATVTAYERLTGSFDLHPDLHRVWANDERYRRDKDREKRTISVEQIRDTSADLALKPHLAGLKVIVIERAETMTTEAANALLKSLEEPTPDTYLLLLADRPGRLPATIRSRCQQLALDLPGVASTLAWLTADGLAPERLPGPALGKPPIVLAGLLSDGDLLSNFIDLYDKIEKLFRGQADPHALANQWQGGDVDLALSCLIENLQGRIRSRLAPAHSNPVTDKARRVNDNFPSRLATDALFAGLEMAENLRDQLGRGTNVELALKALLLGLDAPRGQGVNA